VIADEVVERVKESADIVQIVGEFVKLRRMGTGFRGPCPFHNGSGPNFAVSPKNNTYHCFVCSESGDVFTFVQKKLGLDFTSAVKYVGERTGIDVIDSPRRAQPPDPNARSWEVLASAAAWFRTQLMDPNVGRVALEYLEQRGIDAEAIEKFGLGYAPRDATALRSHLHTLGFDDARQLESGILMLRDGESEPRINFRHRVMFPIVDELGHHVAFGGRALGDGTPKYLNSAESAVFQKRRTLYGMHTAKHAMRRTERALVVEGYMDAIRLSLVGVDEVVAPLGTALTEEQTALIVKHAHEVFLLYDSDEAGQKATFKAGKQLLGLKASVRVVSFPNGEDPDSFVRKHGRGGLEAHLAQAVDLFDRQVQLLERLGWFSDLTKRRRAVDKLLPTIRAAADPLTRDFYLTRLAEITHLEKGSLQKELDEPAHPERGSSRALPAVRPPNAAAPAPANEGEWSGEPMPDGPPKTRSWQGRSGQGQWKRRNANTAPEWRASWIPPSGGVEEPAERALVSAMLADRNLVERIAERHGPNDFRDARYKALFGVLLMAGSDEALDEIAERVDEDTAAALRELLHRPDGRDPEAVDVQLNLRKLDVRNIEWRLAALRRELTDETSDTQDALRREEQELTQERNRLLPMRSPRGKPGR
jgi:DNA primase